jgi:hypothetical protein
MLGKMKRVMWQILLRLMFCVLMTFGSQTSFANSGYFITKQKQCKILIGNLANLKLKDRLTFITAENLKVTVEISGINKAQGAIGWIIPREKCPNILGLEGTVEKKEDSFESEAKGDASTPTPAPGESLKKQATDSLKHSLGLAFAWDLLSFDGQEKDSGFSGPSFGFYYQLNGGKQVGATWSMRIASYFSILSNQVSAAGMTVKSQLLYAGLDLAPQLLIMRCGDVQSFGCHIGPELGYSSGQAKTTATSNEESLQLEGTVTAQIQNFSYGVRTGLLYLPGKNSRFDFTLAYRMGKLTSSIDSHGRSSDFSLWRFEVAYEYAF